MNNLSKLAIVALALCLMVSLFSCGAGGTIVVNNKYAEDVSVTVYSDFKEPDRDGNFQYWDKYGPEIMTSDSTSIFNVSTNGKYGIIWRLAGDTRFTTTHVSNGEQVEITIP